MEYKDRKIDYINFLRNKPREADPEKIGTMKARLDQAVLDAGIKGRVTCTYYVDGNIKVDVNGKYFNMFNAKTGKFFSGSPGDEPSRA